MELRASTISRLRDALLASGERKGSVTSSAYRTLFQRDLLTATENKALKRVAPHAESMFLVMAADGQITDTELAALRGAVRGLSGDLLSDQIVQLMMEKYAHLLRDEGLDERLDAISQCLDVGEAPDAFALAAAVALADGRFDDSESTVLEKMRTKYGISDEQAAKVREELATDS